MGTHLKTLHKHTSQTFQLAHNYDPTTVNTISTVTGGHNDTEPFWYDFDLVEVASSGHRGIRKTIRMNEMWVGLLSNGLVLSWSCWTQYEGITNVECGKINLTW